MWLEEGGSISLRVTVARDVAAQWGWKIDPYDTNGGKSIIKPELMILEYHKRA
jgi:hypothetical protein